MRDQYCKEKREKKEKRLSDVVGRLNQALKDKGSELVFGLNPNEYDEGEAVAQVGASKIKFTVSDSYGVKRNAIVFKSSVPFNPYRRSNEVRGYPYNIDLDKANWDKVAESVLKYEVKVRDFGLKVKEAEADKAVKENEFTVALNKFNKESGSQVGWLKGLVFETSVGEFKVTVRGLTVEVNLEPEVFSAKDLDKLKEVIEKLKKL